MRILGQTLFLGASVVSYSVNIGWGGNNSSLTVELIEDMQPFGKIPFRKFDQGKNSADYGDPFINGLIPVPKSSIGVLNIDIGLGVDFYTINHYNASPGNTIFPNHYYQCSGEECYVDEVGTRYSQSITKKEKNIPGKIYYKWVGNKFVSEYWYAEDPGFFATGTRINNAGAYESGLGRTTTNPNDLYIYDIINTPVYFKFDNFEFIGIVKSWERNNRPGGITYSVTIESFDEILDNCHVILQSFNGSIFNATESAAGAIANALNSVGVTNFVTKKQVGGPTNFPPPPTVSSFDNDIKYGNIPNIFNVYGFLENMGNAGFGGARLNNDGLRANDIIDSIQVLTSATECTVGGSPGVAGTSSLRDADKAFSPFGRILTKNISNARTYAPLPSFNAFGIISSYSPTRTSPNRFKSYNSFKLDLSSLPRTPDSYRIQGNPSLSILSIIRQICDDSGVDFLTTVIPVSVNTVNGTISTAPTADSTDFIIKIIAVNRTNYNPIYTIPSLITRLENNNYTIENSSFGQEKNNNFTRKIVFGGNQQRLYQVKNYRLSYNQTNFIYNPILKKFIDLSSNDRIVRNQINKVRIPNLHSTRNKFLSDYINANESEIFLRDDNLSTSRFSSSTDDFTDTEIGRTTDIIVSGNYNPIIEFNNKPAISGTRGSRKVHERYIPLYMDVISPYFGLKAESAAPIGDDSNEFRVPRPVLLDSWTNQITVVFDINELPILSIGEPLTLYDPAVFGTPTAGDPGSGLDAKNGGTTGGQQPNANPTNFGKPASEGVVPTRSFVYKNPGFTIKETELRCPSFDSYLTYCLGKSIYSKPDLFVMLVNAYKQKGIFLTAPSGNATTLDMGNGGLGAKNNGMASNNPNISNNGIPSDPVQAIRTKMDIDWDIWLNHNFIKDLQIIFEFIKNISDSYYGKKYAIKSPNLYSYKDTQYTNTLLPSTVGNIYIFQGGNEIFYDYEVADGAWEEYGNYIDDSIVCGDNNWQVLRNDNGLIPTILGYNNSNNIDDITKYWSELTSANRSQKFCDQFPAVCALYFNPSSAWYQGFATAPSFIRMIARDLLSTPPTPLVPSIDISNLDVGSFVVVAKTGNIDAFGRAPPGPASKIYCKTNSDKIVFLNPINLSDPRIIVDAPGIQLANASYSYISDPNLTVVSNIAIEDYCTILNMIGGTSASAMNDDGTINQSSIDTYLKEFEYINYLLQIVFPINEKTGNYTVDTKRLVPKGQSTNNSSQHAMVNPKMATPFFAGVPLKTNRAVYGPWINYPGLVMHTGLADNLIGNIKIEQNPDYVPWNYGGMSFLDKVISYSMNTDINYQSIVENGRVSIVGPPIFGIGGAFSYDSISQKTINTLATNELLYDNTYYKTSGSKVVFTDINTMLVPGITETPPTGILNYAVDVLINPNWENILGSGSPLISNISIQTSEAGVRTSYSFQTYNPKTGLFNKQFSDSIKAQTSQALKFNKLLSSKFNSISNKNLKNFSEIKEKAKQNRESYNTAKHATSLFGTSPVELLIGQSSSYYSAPTGTLTNAQFNSGLRYHHYTAIFPGIETGAELMNDYDSKSAMSLDGLLSPISFYPTRLNGTFSISDHLLKPSGNFNSNILDSSIIPICPRCGNTRKIKINYIDYSTTTKTNTDIEIACPACSSSKKINIGNKSSSSLPGSSNINIYSLNPIIVSSGEFRNPHVPATGKPMHSILAISRGEIFSSVSGDNRFVTFNNLSNTGNYDYSAYDPRFNMTGSGVLMNQRFFGLRGPIMLHSWGFDTDGYPVPNANDEPLQFDTYNRPLRFVLNTGTLANDLTKAGKYVPDTTDPHLGDIVSVNYVFAGNKWTKRSNTPSVFFHDKWGERPDLWPVGPIDMRWDHKRKVWDAGGCRAEVLPPCIISNKNDASTLEEFLVNRDSNSCPYKMIYVTLEQDMTKDDNYETTFPARGFIDDVEYSKEPLQNNYRRLVYIIDTAGYTAPKGAKLLCRYNRDNGFYEPVTKPILTALGTIAGTQAKIEMSYTNGRRSGVLPIFATTFYNPLNLTLGTKGLFNYINGKWTLISTK